MPDVFISYSHNDSDTAQAIRHTLEARRVRCWMDTGSLQHGDDWKLQIVDALSTSSVVVLVLSSHSNASKDVKAEIDVAYRHEIPILPFCIEKVQMRKEFEYIIGGRHWLDALTPPLEEHIARLCNSVEALLAARRASAGDSAETQTAGSETRAAEQSQSAKAAAPPVKAVEAPRATTARKPFSRVVIAVAAITIVAVIGGIAFHRQLAGLLASASTTSGESGKTTTAWAIPPLLPGDWQEVTGKARSDELTRVESSEFFPARQSPEVRGMRRLALSFSPGATLYELEISRNNAPGLLTYVHLGDRLVLIDGTPRGVADVVSPQHAQVRSAADAESFVRFLAAGLQAPASSEAPAGVYRFVNDTSEVGFTPDATPEQRAVVARSISPIKTERVGNRWRVTGATTVGHAVVESEVTIDETGIPQMRLVKMLAEAAPIPLDMYDDLGVRVRRVMP